jgi:hypothetical protein
MNPEAFGRYLLIRKLAVGGMTELFLAQPKERTRSPGRMVIKRLFPSLGDEAGIVEAFRSEALIAGHFIHPNIVRIHEYGQVQDFHYIAREFIQGATLGDVLRQAERESMQLMPALVLRVMLSACARTPAGAGGIPGRPGVGAHPWAPERADAAALQGPQGRGRALRKSAGAPPRAPPCRISC